MLKGLLALTLVFILVYTPSVLYAQQLNVTVDTDRRFYREGDIMQLYVEINQFHENTPLNIRLLSPADTLFNVNILPEFDQKASVARYSYSFLLVNEKLVTGDYMIIAEYGNVEASKKVKILKPIALEYTQHYDTIDVLVKNLRLSNAVLSSVSLLLEDVTNPSFSFPKELSVSMKNDRNVLQVDLQKFNLEPNEQSRFSIRSESLLNKSVDLCWSSYGSSTTIWLCNIDAMQDSVAKNAVPIPMQNADEEQEKTKSNQEVAKKLKLPELKMPGIEALVLGYSFDMDVNEIESDIKELLEQDEEIKYPLGDIDYAYDGAKVTASDGNLYLKANGDKLDFTLYLHDLSIKNGYVDVNLDTMKLNGNALYNEQKSLLKVTIPSQAALIEIIKAILGL